MAEPTSPFAESAVPHGSEADLPKVMDLVSQTINEVTKDFAQFLVAGLAPGIALMFVGFAAVFVIYGGMFLGMLPGLIAESDELVALGSMGAAMFGFFALFAVIFAVVIPISASLYRAVWAYLTKGEKLQFGSAFSTATQDLPLVYGYSVLSTLAVLVGLMFCYLPGLIVQAMLVFGFPAVVIHRLSPGAAISLSMGHATKYPSWHLGFFCVNFVLGLVLSYVPLIGTMLVMTIQPLFLLMAYRACFGDGDLPRMEA